MLKVLFWTAAIVAVARLVAKTTVLAEVSGKVKNYVTDKIDELMPV